MLKHFLDALAVMKTAQDQNIIARLIHRLINERLGCASLIVTDVDPNSSVRVNAVIATFIWRENNVGDMDADATLNHIRKMIDEKRLRGFFTFDNNDV